MTVVVYIYKILSEVERACRLTVAMCCTQAESCIIMRPFVYKLTRSELHAVMTGGFATVAGSYIAVLIEIGVSARRRDFIALHCTRVK